MAVTPKRLSCGALGFAIISVLLLFGIWLRYGVLQSDVVAARCTATSAPWWCAGRNALGLLIHFRVFGWLAVAAGIASWWIGGRTLAFIGLAAGVLGLSMYNTDLAAVGGVLALLRAVRA